MISRGCSYHIVRLQDLESETPPIELFREVREFLKVFPNDLPRIEIDFGFYFLPDINSISIPSYSMALTELKELKAQLKWSFLNGVLRYCS